MRDGWAGLIASGEMLNADVAGSIAEVSLIRSEYVIRDSNSASSTPVGRSALISYVTHLAAQLYPKTVWYRLSDFEDRELLTLEGHGDVSVLENPILSVRGARRALAYPDEYLAEMDAVAEVSARFSNVKVIASYVGESSEFAELCRLAKQSGFPPPEGCMIETPAALDDWKTLRHLGAQRLVAGMQDLTMNYLGAHRGTAEHNRRNANLNLRLSELAAALGDNFVVANPESSEHVAELRSGGISGIAVKYADLPFCTALVSAQLPEADVISRISIKTTSRLRALGL